MIGAPKIVPLRPSNPARSGASWRDILSIRIAERCHRFLNYLGVPGAIQPMVWHDDVTGQQISVDVGVFFTRLSVDGRDYYFDRLTGRFDGTGMSVA